MSDTPTFFSVVLGYINDLHADILTGGYIFGAIHNLITSVLASPTDMDNFNFELCPWMMDYLAPSNEKHGLDSLVVIRANKSSH